MPGISLIILSPYILPEFPCATLRPFRLYTINDDAAAPPYCYSQRPRPIALPEAPLYREPPYRRYRCYSYCRIFYQSVYALPPIGHLHRITASAFYVDLPLSGRPSSLPPAQTVGDAPPRHFPSLLGYPDVSSSRDSDDVDLAICERKRNPPPRPRPLAPHQIRFLRYIGRQLL